MILNNIFDKDAISPPSVDLYIANNASILVLVANELNIYNYLFLQ